MRVLPNPIKKVAPDGAAYYEHEIKLTIRVLTDEYYVPGTGWVNPTTQPGHDAGFYRIGWNKHFCATINLAIANVAVGRLGYYPIGFFTGYLPAIGGSYRLAYRYDYEIMPGLPPGAANSIVDMFTRGFRSND